MIPAANLAHIDRTLQRMAQPLSLHDLAHVQDDAFPPEPLHGEWYTQTANVRANRPQQPAAIARRKTMGAKHDAFREHYARECAGEGACNVSQFVERLARRAGMTTAGTRIVMRKLGLEPKIDQSHYVKRMKKRA